MAWENLSSEISEMFSAYEGVFESDIFNSECFGVYREPTSEVAKEESRTRQKEIYARRRALGVCVSCARRKEEPSKTRCAGVCFSSGWRAND